MSFSKNVNGTIASLELESLFSTIQSVIMNEYEMAIEISKEYFLVGIKRTDESRGQSVIM